MRKSLFSVVTRLIFLSFFTIILVYCEKNDQEPEEYVPNLYPVLYSRQWGFMNRKGEVVISPQYEDVKQFYYGYAAVSKNRLWGYIDEEGELVIPHEYYEPFSFAEEGLVRVHYSSGYGFLNGKNELLNNEIFNVAHDFSEGCAAISRDPNEYKYGYIDQSGNIVIQPKYISASRFSEGYALVRDSLGYSIIDKSGNKTSEAQTDIWYPVDDIRFFSQGLMPVVSFT